MEPLLTLAAQVNTCHLVAMAGLLARHLLALAGLSLASSLAASLPGLLSAALVALVLPGLFSAALAALALSPPRFRGSSRPLAPRLASLLLVLLSVALLGQVRAESWSTDLCVSPTGIGSSSSAGAPFTILGSAGSSVRRLRVYRNSGNNTYLRGVVAFFSDDSEMRGGVRKDQHLDIEFADDEVITSMTLWQLASSSSSSARVARIDLTTSHRSWGYGMEDTARLSSKAVSVGSGILVGFQGRAGDDLDFLAPVFLRTVSDSTVSDIRFEKANTDDGLRLVTLREGSAVYNGSDYSWTFSGSESRTSSTSFSGGFTSSLSASTTFQAKIPSFFEGSIGSSMSAGTSDSHSQSSGDAVQLSWSTTVALSSDVPSVSCSALVWEGHLNVRWSGIQTVSAGGASVSFPVSGSLRHVAYGKVETVCRPLERVARRFVA